MKNLWVLLLFVATLMAFACGGNSTENATDNLASAFPNQVEDEYEKQWVRCDKCPDRSPGAPSEVKKMFGNDALGFKSAAYVPEEFDLNNYSGGEYSPQSAKYVTAVQFSSFETAQKHLKERYIYFMANGGNYSMWTSGNLFYECPSCTDSFGFHFGPYELSDKDIGRKRP